MRAPALLRWLLRLFPRAYRDRYGREMKEVVRHRYATAEGRSRLLLHLEVGADLAWSAAVIRARSVAGGIAGGLRGIALDLRFVARGLRGSPGYAATALLTLAVAVGVNTAVFSFVRGTLLHHPPYPEPDRVVIAWGSNPANGQVRDVVSGSNFIDLSRRAGSVEALAAVHPGDAVVMEDGRPLSLGALDVSVEFLDVLGVSPVLGRDFDERDHTSSAPATALVSHRFWRERLGGDPDALGDALPINGEPHTILGVLPEDFEFLGPSPVLLPLRDDALAAEDRTHHHYWLVGRLAPGATPATATREMSAIFRDIAREDPRLSGWSVLVEPLFEVSVEAVRPVLWILGAATGLVLLIAVANLAGLFRIRSLGRVEELAVRVALGAGRRHVARVLLLESVVLGIAGGALGLGLAWAGLPWLAGMVPAAVPIPESAATASVMRSSLDPLVAGGALLAAVLAGVLLALPSLPGALAPRPAAAPARAGTRVSRTAGGTGWLVVAELAIATVLCVGAGLTVRSAENLVGTDLGVETDGVLTMYVGAVDERDAAGRAAYFREILSRVRAVPGVLDAGVNDYVPLQGEDDFEGVRFPDRPPPPPGRDLREEWRRVSEGLFAAAGMRILEGRALERRDMESSPRAAVVNEAFARRHFGDEPALGRPLTLTADGYRELEVVGIVADVRARGPAEPAPPVVYVPYQGEPRGNMALFVRVDGDPRAYIDPVREAVWSVDSSQPIDRIFSMRAMADRALAIPRLARALVGGLAVIALLVAAVGVFGIVGYRVGSRTRELGIRLALGATARRIQREVMLEAAPVVLVGVGAGLGGGVVAAHAARSLLHGVSPQDLASLALAAAVVAPLALTATWLPALRVSRIDPQEAIRAE